ncbi:MAG: diguanylate cyclase [Spirochaetes bacterium]|nr:MAG: diguanylate cyclase [Spirochaetota bacterium]
MGKLTTQYLGLELKNPVIAGASGFTGNIKSIKKLDEAGIGAIVIKSLFEEQIIFDANKTLKSGGIVYGYDDIDDYVGFYEKKHSISKYTELIKEAKKTVTAPVIASINCASSGQWTSFAKKVEAAGADALQLNMFILPFDTKKSGQEIDDEYVKTVAMVKELVSIPISVKLSYHFSNIFQIINRLGQAGADGFVLFNRFFSPDLDINTLEHTSANFFSDPAENILTMRWIGMLYSKTTKNLAAATGVHSGEDLIKMILLGADAAEVVSTLYKNKPAVIGEMLKTLEEWMDNQKFDSISAFKGLKSQKDSLNPEVFNRVQYMKHYGELKK